MIKIVFQRPSIVSTLRDCLGKMFPKSVWVSMDPPTSDYY
jgi:hypothetical protein